MDSRSKQLFQKSLSTDICIPNTVVVPSDAAVDDEKVVLTIRLFNEELIPVFDATADICVEIKDPDNDILRPSAEDYTEKDGTYKVYFVAPKAGRYNAHVLVNNKCINTAGYQFSALEQYSYNKRKHSFRISLRLTTGNTSSRSTSGMTTGMLTSMSSARLPTIMSGGRSVRSEGILFQDTPRSKGILMLKPLSTLNILDETNQQYVSPRSIKDNMRTEPFCYGNGFLKVVPYTSDLTPRRFSEPITERKQLYNDVNCISIAFDAAVSHPSVDVSRDSLNISLRSTKQIYGSSPRGTTTRRLRRYPGTLGTRCFSKPGLFYWELSVKFRKLRLIRRTVLFEIGLARYDAIDKSFTNDRSPHAWVLSGSGCHLCDKVCLHGWHNGQMLSHTPFSDRLPSGIRMYSKLHYGCLLDTSKREWIIVDLRNKKVVAHFKNLLVSEVKEPLWPIFAIYNPEQANVSMEISYGSDISGISEEALDALSI